MHQSQLDRKIADATGEDVAEIRHRGFSLLDPAADVDFDPEPPEAACPAVVDFDNVDLLRNTALFGGPDRDRRAA